MPDPLDQPVAPHLPSSDDGGVDPATSRPASGDEIPSSGATVEPRADDDGHDDSARGIRPAAARAATTTVDEVTPRSADDGDDDGPAAGGPAVDDSDGADGEPEDRSRKPRSRTRTLVEWGLVIGGALLVALVVRSTLAQAFWIPSPSMEPTLHEGDRVLVNKLSYDLHDVNRGDIIVFERPENARSLNPEDDISDLIKRVIGLPGDVIESRPDGYVYVNDRRLDEPYLPDGTRTTGLERQEVPGGHVFVMGDNRSNSSDSREFGPVDEDLIVGRAFIRIWPIGDIGGL